jgi:hypothetical protein
VARGWNDFLSGAPQIPLGTALGDAAGDALRLQVKLHDLGDRRCREDGTAPASRDSSRLGPSFCVVQVVAVVSAASSDMLLGAVGSFCLIKISFQGFLSC